MVATAGNPAEPPGVGGHKRASRSEAAFDQFVRDQHAALVRFVRMIVRDKATAEDVVQETMARAYLNWGDLWPDGNPGGWSHRVAHNLAVSWRRRAARETKAVLRLGKREPLETPGPEAHPELERAVDRLPPRQRRVVALYYVLGLSVDDAAAVMGCRPGTVKSLLFHARERLRQELGDADE